MAEAGYQKDMSHTTWERVYQRQMARRAEAQEWIDRLQLAPGETLIDIGCGPGMLSLMAATVVGPTGKVIALDRSAAALDYLEHLQTEHNVTNIRRVTGDAADAPLAGEHITAALLTVMLHHTDIAADIVMATSKLLAPGGRCVIAEYLPDAEGHVGPPLAERIRPGQLRSWCEQAGFTVDEFWVQGSELYAMLVRKA